MLGLRSIRGRISWQSSLQAPAYHHNNVRYSVAEYLRLVTNDVRIEPLLTPKESPNFQQKGKSTDKARLDISARGVWSTFKRTFFDVRIINAKSLSYQSYQDHTPAIQPAFKKEKDYNNQN